MVLDIVEVHHRVLLAVDIVSPHFAHQAVVVEISARSIGSGMPQGMYGEPVEKEKDAKEDVERDDVRREGPGGAVEGHAGWEPPLE